MRLVQYITETGERCLGLVSGDGRALASLRGYATTYELARAATLSGRRMAELVAEAAHDARVDYAQLLQRCRVLPPLDHPDPAHCLITGTGLTHTGSAEARDAMHRAQQADVAELSDSMRMFRLGIEGGKLQDGRPGIAPEWFYKGDGTIIARPGKPLVMPSFARDGGEEAEIACLYLIDDAGRPRRVGYALGNEFSDHVLERQNYLYLAHSKLRACSFGPEVLVGDLPQDVRGTVRIRRGEQVLFETEFVSGEANMSHSLANLEHHHFKYRLFRRPGDVHVHFIGASVLSFTAGIKTEAGDEFEIASTTFGAPLRNPLAIAEDEGLIRVEPL